MTLMQGITFAGAAISLVGNITGNKTLSQIGMVAGLAGGIGSFAEKAGLFDSGNLGKALGYTDITYADMVGSPTPLDWSTMTSSGAGESSMAQSIVDGGGADVPLSPLNISEPGSLNTPGGGGNLLNTPTAAVAPPALQADYSLSGTSPGLKPPALGLPAAQPNAMDLFKQGKYGDAAAAAGSGAMDMLKNNPTGAYVAAKAVGGLADWLSGKSEAELEQIKASTGYANAKALEVQATVDREKMRRANLNAGYGSVNAGFKINPNAVVAQPPGLVAGAMQPRSA